MNTRFSTTDEPSTGDSTPSDSPIDSYGEELPTEEPGAEDPTVESPSTGDIGLIVYMFIAAVMSTAAIIFLRKKNC